MRAYPLLIETHGKQAFIFGTGKRREAVGASYLVHAVTDWARDALGGTAASTIAAGDPAEIMVATSGTVLAFVADREHAVGVVRAVTGRALTDAPGLGVTGVVGKEPVDWDGGGAPDAVGVVFRAMGEVRAGTPGPSARFPVLPITELCPSSALPVAGFTAIDGQRVPRSAPSLGKLAAFEPALERLHRLSGLGVAHLRSTTLLLAGDHEDSPDRVAVVHADGNGLGGLVSRLADHVVPHGCPNPDTVYAQRYREFSTALDGAAQGALRAAISRVEETTGRTPLLLPLVIGGDDITFVCDAGVALELTCTFLTEFVQIAAGDAAIAAAVTSASQRSGAGADPRLGIGAGLAVVSPHFPFAAAYELAEELLTDVAKQAKSTVTDTAGHPIPCVSLAGHVQFDTTSVGLDQRLAALTVADKLLTAAPYVEFVEVEGAAREMSPESLDWLRGRRLEPDLYALARALVRRDDDGRRLLPATQVHELRARLRPDPAMAQEYLRRLVAADPVTWKPLLEDGALFTTRAQGPPTTRLLDALTFAPFVADAPAAGEGRG